MMDYMSFIQVKKIFPFFQETPIAMADFVTVNALAPGL